jgi:hypothetical protein
MERTPGTATAVIVGAASVQLIAANPNRIGLYIKILGNNNTISLGFGVAAVFNSGITLTTANGGADCVFRMDELTHYTGAINAISNIAANPVAILEWT